MTVTEAASPDRDALVALYNATGGENWRISTNWNGSAALDRWFGVKTDADGRVTIWNFLPTD